MNKEQVLHFYLGCECTYGKQTVVYGKLIGVEQDAAITWNTIDGRKIWNIKEIKPFLRPLSDMTEAEMTECGNMLYDFSEDPELNKWKYQDFEYGLDASQFLWLLKKNFDLFGLIESGQAINSSKTQEGGSK